jgi:hypothetical protein
VRRLYYESGKDRYNVFINTALTHIIVSVRDSRLGIGFSRILPKKSISSTDSATSLRPRPRAQAFVSISAEISRCKTV